MLFQTMPVHWKVIVVPQETKAYLALLGPRASTSKHIGRAGVLDGKVQVFTELPLAPLTRSHVSAVCGLSHHEEGTNLGRGQVPGDLARDA